MEPERWRILEPLLDQALDLSVEDRVKWLGQLRARSPDIVEELTAILSGQSGADQSGFLLEQPDVTLAGLELGAYRLEQPLGQGGMGTVWLARRIDGRFEGVAAVKLLNLSLLTPKGLEQFRREGSTLSLLTHPGIARLLDAGVSSTGQPYLILEHIDGQPIDAYVRSHDLSIADRVRLVGQVLAAVAHAHANLIVHRDIKPSNILVTADGAVKLLDFGIAKLLDDEGLGDRSTLTAEGAGAMTPKYAAPEQLRGEPVTTATDVYALGVLLYLLLSGKHPTAEGCRTPPETIRALFEAEPARLKLGDLDTILLKALRKNPADRYQSVAALADDLERYRLRQPVSARPNSFAYRMGKFVRRNQAAVIVGAIALGGLVAASIFSLKQRNEARLQRDAALKESDRVERVLTFQSQLLSQPSVQPLTMRQLLDRGLSLLDRSNARSRATQADIVANLANIYWNLRELPTTRVLMARAESLATAAGETEMALRIQCSIARMLAETDKVDSSISALRRFEELGPAQDQLDPRTHAMCLDARANLLTAQEHGDSAILVWQHALSLLESVHRTTSQAYLVVLSNLGAELRELGRFREAVDVQRRSVAAQEAMGQGGTVLQVGELRNLALSLMFLGEVAGADSLIRQAAPFQDTIYATRAQSGIIVDRAAVTFLMGWPDTSLMWFTRLADLAQRDSNLALERRALFGRGRSEVVLSQLAAARLTLGLLRGLRDSASAPMSRDELHLMAWIRDAEGDLKGADSALTAVLERDGYFTGTTNPGTRQVLLKAAEVALALGDPPRALKLAGDARKMATIDSLSEARSMYVGEARTLEARALLASGDTSAARAALVQALPALRIGGGPTHQRTLEADSLLTKLH